MDNSSLKGTVFLAHYVHRVHMPLDRLQPALLVQQVIFQLQEVHHVIHALLDQPLYQVVQLAAIGKSYIKDQLSIIIIDTIQCTGYFC